MEIWEELEVEFKEVKLTCKCGEVSKKVILIINGYGFDDIKCQKCGRRSIVEYDDNAVCVRS